MARQSFECAESTGLFYLDRGGAWPMCISNLVNSKKSSVERTHHRVYREYRRASEQVVDWSASHRSVVDGGQREDARSRLEAYAEMVGDCQIGALQRRSVEAPGIT